MRPTEQCLSEEELWTVVQNSHACEPPHLQTCRHCRSRLKQMKSTLKDLNRYLSEADRFDQQLTESVKSSHLLDATANQTVTENITRHSHPVNAGNRLSRYHIIKLLNSGGQGDVYLAEDSDLRRQVAVKISHASIDEGLGTAEKIMSEAELLARMNNPHLAQVYDSGIYSGHPYLVMEFVDGCTLKDFSSRYKLTTSMIRRIMNQVCRAVEALHAHGILHLDLKPENVMIMPDGRCKLIDLGTSWLTTEANNHPDVIVGGTIGYMSPEQFEHRLEDFNQTTDVFGLGAILFLLLTLASNAKSSPTAQAARALTWDHKRRELQQSNVNRRLKNLCLRATHPQPEQRFQNAREFRRYLEGNLHRRRSLPLLIIGVIACLQGLASLSFQQIEENHPRPQSRKPSPQHTHTTGDPIAKNWWLLKADLRNRSVSEIKFCIWSKESLLHIIPAHLTDDRQQQASYILKTAYDGLQIPFTTQPVGVLAVSADELSVDDMAELPLLLERTLTDELQNVSFDQQCPADHPPKHQFGQVFHLKNNSPVAISGVFILPIHDPTVPPLYEVSLSMNNPNENRVFLNAPPTRTLE